MCVCVCVRACVVRRCVCSYASIRFLPKILCEQIFDESLGLRLRLLSHVPFTICITKDETHLIPGFLTHLSLRSRCFHAMRSRASVPGSSAPVAGCRRARSASAAAPTERFGDVKEPGRFYLYNAKMKDKESNEQGIFSIGSRSTVMTVIRARRGFEVYDLWLRV